MPALLPPLGAAGRAVLVRLLPHGGQLTARRNAWAAMAADAARARARAEAAAALAAAVASTQPAAAARR